MTPTPRPTPTPLPPKEIDEAHLWVVFDEEGVGVMGPFGFGHERFDVTVIVYGDGRFARYERSVILAQPPAFTHGVRTARLTRSIGEADIQSIDVERISAWAVVKSSGSSLYDDLTGLNCYRQVSDPDFWGCLENE